jgi:Protein of unknown function (DUF3500)
MLMSKKVKFRTGQQVIQVFRRMILADVVLTLALVVLSSESAKADTPQSATSKIVREANAFLATLSEKQRSAVLYKFDDDQQRVRWSNFPTGFVPRGGLSLEEFSDIQRNAALALVASTLSQKGIEKVEEIREADDVFKAIPHQHPPFRNNKDGEPKQPPFSGAKDGPAAGGFKDGAPNHEMFGKNLYYISILGTPSEKDRWMLQFGGHHLALNITIVGDRGTLTPSLTGAQPGTYTTNGKTVRPLGQENDKGFALLNALDDGQRKQAILNYRVADLVLGPGHDGQTIQPEGLKASAMDERQRLMLLDLISEWVGIANDNFAAARMVEIKAGLEDTWFAWSGPTTVEPGKNGTSYYRIQGPKLIIEYAPQPGEDHVHTIYRDPRNDYGRALTSK